MRERQVLLTIPDTTVMAVRVQVHESFVKKVKPGQPARIRVDAYPNEQLTGEVYRIAVLPDAQNRWLNPDLKVYSTNIHIDGEYDWLKARHDCRSGNHCRGHLRRCSGACSCRESRKR